MSSFVIKQTDLELQNGAIFNLKPATKEMQCVKPVGVQMHQFHFWLYWGVLVREYRSVMNYQTGAVT